MEQGHLVLMRRPGEEILISDNIIVQVVRINGLQTHLKITAPKDYPIHRREVYERIQKERQAKNVIFSMPWGLDSHVID